MSLIRRVIGIHAALTPYAIAENFCQPFYRILKKNAGQHNRFTSAQMQWLRMIKDYVVGSFHVEKEDFELDPFNKLQAA